MSQKKKKRKARAADINVDMTPLIDVVFLLMIFFMIISTFNQMEREAVKELPVSRFQAAVDHDITRDRLIVNILEDGAISLFGQRFTLAGFNEQLARYRPALQRFSGETGEAPIILRGHRDARYESVREVLTTLYENDFRFIMFAAHQPKDTPE